MIATVADMLAPLLGETRVVEGGDEGHRAAIALREALVSEGNCSVTGVSEGFCSALVMTVEGLLAVRAFSDGAMGRVMPGRFSEAAREWRAMWACIDREVPCARPIALLAASGRSFLVIERPAAVVPLGEWMERERAALLESPRVAKALVSALGAFVARVHRAGILLRGPWLTRLAVRPPRAHPGRFEFQLTELREKPRATSEADRLRNLAEFSLASGAWPRTLRLRFFRDYRGLFLDEQGERAALREIAERTQKLRFDANTQLVARCTEPSAMQRVLQSGGARLLIFRKYASVALPELERALGMAGAEQWESTLAAHFAKRNPGRDVLRLVWPARAGEDAQSARRLEGTWGRLLELDAVGARAPRPLACVVSREALVVFGDVAGRIESMAAHRHDRDWQVVDELAHEMKRLHDSGLFFLPAEVERTLDALAVCVGDGGSRGFLLRTPDQLFRGNPSLLGMQAVASLGRAARAVGQAMGERAAKELVWSYARALFLNADETAMLVEEAARVPTGRTVVMTRGLERARVAGGARP